MSHSWPSSSIVVAAASRWSWLELFQLLPAAGPQNKKVKQISQVQPAPGMIEVKFHSELHLGGLSGGASDQG